MRTFDRRPSAQLMDASENPRWARKWFWMFSVLIALCAVSAYLLYGPRPHSKLNPVIQSTSLDQTATFPLIRFEFKEPLLPPKQNGFGLPHLPVPSLVGHKLSLFSGGEGWKEHVFHQKTLFKVETDENGENILRAVSKGTSSVLVKEIDVKLSQRPLLTWEWKAVQFPSNKKNEILAAKPDNDFAARVYVAFRGSTPLSSDVIQYVWDDHFPEGTYAESPYSGKTKIIVIQNGPSADWITERRDLIKDYEMLFGKPPHGDVVAVGLMSDSDNTGTSSEAYYRRLVLEKPKI